MHHGRRKISSRRKLKYGEGKRLLEAMKDLITANALYRNYVKRLINVVKRWVREICVITSNQLFPVLNLTEWEYVYEKVTHDLNVVPIAKGQEYSYFSPGSLIYPQCNESLSIPDVKIKMVNVNRMINEHKCREPGQRP